MLEGQLNTIRAQSSTSFEEIELELFKQQIQSLAQGMYVTYSNYDDSVHCNFMQVNYN